jgi:large subunit ribosomal protein L15
LTTLTELNTAVGAGLSILQVLGTGELTTKLVVKAAAFSATAKQKIEAAGGEAVELPQKPTWTRELHAAQAAAKN